VCETLFELPVFEHIDVKNVAEALSWLHKSGEKAAVFAGGTDLLALMKDRVQGPGLKVPEILVNIKTIPEMNEVIQDKAMGLIIGAAVTLNRLESSGVIKDKFNILSQAARQIGTTQIRNMGTVGGNLCQRPRCLYFRKSSFLCLKKGGSKCYALGGEHRDHYAILKTGKCIMAHPSDLAPALVALKATAVISSPKGEKEVALEDFFLGPNHLKETILQPDEFLTAVRVPESKGGSHQFFLKHRIRNTSDFALASVAAVAHLSGETVEGLRMALGGIAPSPYLALKAGEILKGRKLEEGLIAQAAELAAEGAHPLPMNHYKIDLTKALVKRALTQVREHAARTGIGC